MRPSNHYFHQWNSAWVFLNWPGTSILWPDTSILWSGTSIVHVPCKCGQAVLSGCGSGSLLLCDMWTDKMVGKSQEGLKPFVYWEPGHVLGRPTPLYSQTRASASVGEGQGSECFLLPRLSDLLLTEGVHLEFSVMVNGILFLLWASGLKPQTWRLMVQTHSRLPLTQSEGQPAWGLSQSWVPWLLGHFCHLETLPFPLSAFLLSELYLLGQLCQEN